VGGAGWGPAVSCLDLTLAPKGHPQPLHIYTHLVLAHALQPHLQPGDPPAYFLGSIIPDVRYLAGTRRRQTHLTALQLLAYGQRFPHLESFLLGYQVHIEIDLIDLTRVLFEHTPFRLLSPLRQLQLSAILIEEHFLEHIRINPPLSDESNDMLSDLGIEAEHVRQFAQGARRFLEQPSLQAELLALQDAQILQDRRAHAYLRMIQLFENSRRLRRFLFQKVPLAETAARLPSILLKSPVLKTFIRD
jgi:hypothetical protein